VERLKGALIIGFLRLFALLPWRMVQGLGAAIGWLSYKLPNRSREVTRINLSRCFPELDEQQLEQLLRRSLISIGMTLTESACAWIWPAQKTLSLVREVEGLEHLQRALESGKGLVTLSSHLGNWEVLLHYLGLHCKAAILYRPIKMKAVDELLQKQRVQMGNEVVPSTPAGILSLIKKVRRGGVAGIAVDPEPALANGVFVPFCGVPALTSKFATSLLKGHKAVGVFLHAVRLPDGSGYRVIVEPAPEAMYAEDDEQAVAAMVQVLERQVRANPEQYMWNMKRFKRRPPGEAKWY
jgi:KDO2-lipid IV(A) lauroyltransferase